MKSSVVRFLLLAALLLPAACAHREPGPPAGSPSPGPDAPTKPGSPYRVTRSSVRHARAAMQSGRLMEALRIYQAILDETPPEDGRRAEALYWAGMLRLSSDPALRDVQAGRGSLRALGAGYPSWERHYEAALALALTDEVEAQRAAFAASEASRAEADRAVEACRSEKQEMSGQTASALDEVKALKSQLTAGRAEADGLREELRRKDEALRKVKEVLVGWKPSR